MPFRSLRFKTCSKGHNAAKILFGISTLFTALSVFATQNTSTDHGSGELLQFKNSLVTKTTQLSQVQSVSDYSWFHFTRKFELNTHSDNRALFNSSEPAIGAASSVGVVNAYDTNNNSQIWTQGEELTSNGERLLEMISDPSSVGLPDSLQQSLSSVSALSGKSVKESEMDALFDNLVKAIGSGIVDPLIAQKEWKRESDLVDSKQLRRQILSGVQSLDDAINSITPQHWMYQSLQKMLVELEGIDQEKQIFTPSKTILEQGMTNPVVKILKNALIQKGDYNPESKVDDQFGSDLTLAVEKFQIRHGLEADGIVNEDTFKALNTPIQSRIDQVRANMERWRWFPAKLEETHILVNIPEYRLRMQHEEDPIFEMNIVVGKPRHMTPIFSETMKHVVFAPTWTVPSSITNEELIPKELRSPGYLKSEEIDFFVRTNRGLQRIDASQITPETLQQKPFPYTLRQRAGEKNVLGKVKFLMPNEHAIYLHDTQAKKLFGEAERAFSHGCIRLSNPDLMAYVIMQLDGHGQSEVRDFMALQDTTTVDLEKHIPVHMAYFTAWQDDSGNMHFREDIYKQDERLIKAINSLASPDFFQSSLSIH